MLQGVIGDPLFFSYKLIGFLTRPENDEGITEYTNHKTLQGPWDVRYDCYNPKKVDIAMGIVLKYP